MTRALPEVLAEVVTQFGRRIVDRPAQLRAALSDTLGADSARDEVTAAIAASTAGVASAIRDADPNEPASAEQIRQWFDQLTDAGLSLRDAALATASWATAFNAHPTAQRTSELAADDGGTAPIPAAPSADRVVDRTDDRTELPAVDGDDRTELVAPARADAAPTAGTRSAPPAPPSSPVSTVGADLAAHAAHAAHAFPPPVGSPVVPAAGRPARRRGPLLIGLAAGVAAVIAAAVIVPLVATRGDADESTTFRRVDVDQFVLSADELEDAVPDGEAQGPYTEQDSGHYTGPSGARWTVPDEPECARMLRRVPPAGEGDDYAPARSSSTSDGPGFVVSSARWYRTSAHARAAFEQIRPIPASCPEFDIDIDGTLVRAVPTVHVDEPNRFVDVLALPEANLARDCRRDRNVIACLYSDRRQDIDAAADTEDVWALAAARADAAEPTQRTKDDSPTDREAP